jgi:hypothetical protein
VEKAAPVEKAADAVENAMMADRSVERNEGWWAAALECGGERGRRPVGCGGERCDGVVALEHMRDGERRGGVVALEHVQLGGRDGWCGEWRGMATGSQYTCGELAHWAGLNGRVRTDRRP